MLIKADFINTEERPILKNLTEGSTSEFCMINRGIILAHFVTRDSRSHPAWNVTWNPVDKGASHFCDQCEYKSHSRYYLTIHKKRHDPAKHECDPCGKEFVSFQELVKHAFTFCRGRNFVEFWFLVMFNLIRYI